MQEQRLTRRVLKFWNMVRKHHDMPEIMRFNPAALEDIWPHCFRIVVEARGKNTVYKYEYMGEAITGIYGRDLTDMVVDQHAKNFPGSVLHPRFNEILHEKRPLHDDGHFINEGGKLIKYRACILPFGDGKKGVTHIVVGLTCRYF